MTTIAGKRIPMIRKSF